MAIVLPEHWGRKSGPYWSYLNVFQSSILSNVFFINQLRSFKRPNQLNESDVLLCFEGLECGSDERVFAEQVRGAIHRNSECYQRPFS